MSALKQPLRGRTAILECVSTLEACAHSMHADDMMQQTRVRYCMQELVQTLHDYYWTANQRNDICSSKTGC